MLRDVEDPLSTPFADLGANFLVVGDGLRLSASIARTVALSRQGLLDWDSWRSSLPALARSVDDVRCISKAIVAVLWPFATRRDNSISSNSDHGLRQFRVETSKLDPLDDCQI